MTRGEVRVNAARTPVEERFRRAGSPYARRVPGRRRMRRKAVMGRVVMLVDNAVDGDSRVQKTARSAADAGWAVTLLGISPDATPRTWRLGAADVRLLPMGGGSAVRQRLAARGGPLVRLAKRARRPVERLQVRYWRARLGDRSWRRLEPGLWNYERAFGAVIDELKPDLIHAHDFRMLGVGAR